jgi:RNA polymerase sigma-70 factor, ECF subfamily
MFDRREARDRPLTPLVLSRPRGRPQTERPWLRDRGFGGDGSMSFLTRGRSARMIQAESPVASGLCPSRVPRVNSGNAIESNVVRSPCVWIGTMPASAASSSLERRVAELPSRSDTHDPAAFWFEEMDRPQLDRAYRLAGLILGDAAEAEDVTQEALLRAWKQRRSLRDPERVQAWFDRILVNACRDRLRRRRPSLRWIDVDDGAPAGKADPFVALQTRDEVLRGLANLSTDHRIVLILRYWADLSVDAIAERLGVPAGTVKSRLHYALGAIRSEIERP